MRRSSGYAETTTHGLFWRLPGSAGPCPQRKSTRVQIGRVGQYRAAASAFTRNPPAADWALQEHHGRSRTRGRGWTRAALVID